MKRNLEVYLSNNKGCVVAQQAGMTDANITNIKKCISKGTMKDGYVIKDGDNIEIWVSRKLGRN